MRPYGRNAVTLRAVVSTLAVSVAAAGCAVVPVRTPLKAVPAMANARDIRVAVFAVATVPQDPRLLAKGSIVSLPDEFLVQQGDQWVFVPGEHPPLTAEFLATLLRQAGLTAAPYASAQGAREDGVKLGLACVIANRTATAAASFWLVVGRLDVAVQIHCGLVDIVSGQELWRGRLNSSVSADPVLFWRSRGLSVESEAMSVRAEAAAQSARVLFVQAYYHLAMDLAATIYRFRGSRE